MELYGRIVSVGVDPNYFWYDMEEGEIASIIETIGDKERCEWERARFISYSSAFCMGNKNKVSATSFLPFPWDNKDKKGSASVELTKEEQSARFNNLVKTLKL